jgi:hypothetical protein
MVDRNARNLFIELLHKVISSEISVKQFFQKMPRSKDLAIHEICSPLVRILTDDGMGYLKGQIKLTDKTIAHYILFLESNLEYEWPPKKKRPFYLLEYFMVKLGLIDLKKDYQEYISHGDIKVWPFIRQSDFEKCERN